MQWRLSLIIHAAHLLALGNFGLELEGRLITIDHQAQHPVDLAELLIHLYPLKSRTADCLAYHRSVLLVG